MANKYLRHGETYCGDGTTSAAATSDGGVGAWNNINVFEGTTPAYGALTAGDVIYVRSKDATGSDITRSISAADVTLGSAVASNANWVTWVLDGGTVWTGVSGTLTYSCSSTAKANFRSYNNYSSEIQDKLVIAEANTSANYKEYGVAAYCLIKNIFYDFSASVSGNGSSLGETGFSILENIHMKTRYHANPSFRVSSNKKLTVINPDVELLDPTCTVEVFKCDGYSQMEIYGGQVRGLGAVSGVRLNNLLDGAKFTSIGLQFPKVMVYGAVSDTNSFLPISMSVGTDGGSGGVIKEPWGVADSRNDNNYPTLSASLPDTAGTPWSWKICPQNTGINKPLKLAQSKYYTESDSVKTITLELAIADSIADVSNKTIWATVSYTEAETGLIRSVSTYNQAGGALAASDAAWSSLTYGATSLLPRMLSITTQTAIKQNTPIIVTIWATAKAASISDTLNDVFFVCPDFKVLS